MGYCRECGVEMLGDPTFSSVCPLCEANAPVIDATYTDVPCDSGFSKQLLPWEQYFQDQPLRGFKETLALVLFSPSKVLQQYQTFQNIKPAVVFIFIHVLLSSFFTYSIFRGMMSVSTGLLGLYELSTPILLILEIYITQFVLSKIMNFQVGRMDVLTVKTLMQPVRLVATFFPLVGWFIQVVYEYKLLRGMLGMSFGQFAFLQMLTGIFVFMFILLVGGIFWLISLLPFASALFLAFSFS